MNEMNDEQNEHQEHRDYSFDAFLPKCKNAVKNLTLFFFILIFALESPYQGYHKPISKVFKCFLICSIKS